MSTAGSGASGGLGFAFVTFLNGTLKSGTDLILEAIALETAIEGADFVITGEGRLDRQTAMGKGPVGVARLGKKHGAKTIALAGALTDGDIFPFFPLCVRWKKPCPRKPHEKIWN